jgi:hypothetical protein
MSDFLAVLDRVHGDYDFYVHLQSDPETALTSYQLDANERAALSDSKMLADALEHALPWRITISGTHDWVNRSPKRKNLDRAELIGPLAKLVLSAENATARRESALRLIQLVG